MIDCRCGNPADSMDSEQCQTCWERYCSRTWWEMVAGLESRDGLEPPKTAETPGIAE